MTCSKIWPLKAIIVLLFLMYTKLSQRGNVTTLKTDSFQPFHSSMAIPLEGKKEATNQPLLMSTSCLPVAFPMFAKRRPLQFHEIIDTF